MLTIPLNSLDDEIHIGIFKSISEFYFKYGGNNNFEKQKMLFDMYLDKTPNNGYSDIKFSKYSDEFIVKLSKELENKEVNWEEEYLLGWKTNINALRVISAEPFSQNEKLLWYVFYLLQGHNCTYLIQVKFWEESMPQISIVKDS